MSHILSVWDFPAGKGHDNVLHKEFAEKSQTGKKILSDSKYTSLPSKMLTTTLA